ncbi:MAG: bifunctional DNA primase/polymerase [bacterium]|nr:bifunctional DNA primase/polymerase [bacterium]
MIQPLKNRAQVFLRQGWSLLPIRGAADPQNAKRPALPSWREYQSRPPTLDEVEGWLASGAVGLGIITGAVSGLVVLDIDHPDQAEAFLKTCPDLAQTFTVQSGQRRLPHYYFALPPAMSCPSRRRTGVELRSDGQYVVAPGTVVNGARWEVVDAQQPRVLTPRDLKRLLAFVGGKAGNVPSGDNWRMAAQDAALPNVPSGDISRSGIRKPQSNQREQNVPTGDNWLIHRYRQCASQIGRNNALFEMVCNARDRGWQQNDVARLLVGVHVTQPPPADHEPETPAQRQREAYATIASAFTRPARSPRPATDHSHSGQLPNAVREKLLQLGLDYVARVLDGLLIAGFRAGQRLTAAVAYQAIKAFGVGRNTVYDALKAATSAGVKLFRPAASDDQMSPVGTFSVDSATTDAESELSPVGTFSGQAAPSGQPPAAPTPAADPSPPGPLNPADAAMRCAEQITNQCFIGRVTKPGKTPGRPEQILLMPSNSDLCAVLEVKPLRTDTLRGDDLRSPAAYRAALHKALIARAPGQYPRRWQAERLGVSKESCRRYERQSGIQPIPVYHMVALDWRNLERTLPDEPLPGTFIEDEQGRRYPALLPLARGLMARKKALVYRRQDANYYTVRPLEAGEIVTTGYNSATHATVEQVQRNVTSGYISDEYGAANRSATSANVTSGYISTPSDAVQAIGQNVTSGYKSALQPPQNVTSGYKSAPKTQENVINSSYSHKLVTQIVTSSRSPATSIGGGGGVKNTSQSRDSSDSITRCTDQLYHALRRINAEKSLTRKAARDVVEEYGVAMVDRALRVLIRREGLHNPAGFVKTWLRGEALNQRAKAGERFLSQPKKTARKPGAQPTSTPSAATPESHEDWLRRLRESPYTAFLANADQILNGGKNEMSPVGTFSEAATS